MPLGEILGELLLRGFLEIVLYGITYYTGAVFLLIISFGQLRLAPLSSVGEIRQGKNRWTDWSLWLDHPQKGRVLKADYVCLVGFVCWVGAGVGLYFAFR